MAALPDLPAGPLVVILGELCGSPMTALALACCSKACARALDAAWPGLAVRWTARFGGGASRPPPAAPHGRSKRLCEREYYAPRRVFARLVELAAFHAAQLHAEVYHLSCEKTLLTPGRLRGMLATWSPIWVSCDGFGKLKDGSLLVELLRSKAVANRCALPIAQELLHWPDAKNSAAPDVSTLGSVLCVACARGFAELVRHLLEAYGSSPPLMLRMRQVVYRGAFVVKGRTVKGVYNASAWGRVMLDAETQAGTPPRALANLKRCVGLLALHGDERSPASSSSSSSSSSSANRIAQ